MALQNRVTPLGDLIADPARGLVYGNRGRLHDDAGKIRRRYATEVDFLGGAVAREAERLGVPAPLHAALYQLIKGKEFSWTAE